MSIEYFRIKLNKILTPLARKFSNLNPNLITWLGLFSSILVGYLFFKSSTIHLLLAPLFILISAFFDVFDGLLARINNKTTKQGDFLDHVFDRYSDIFILGGITLSPLVRDWIGFIAIIGVLLTSYMGTQAMAVGGKRDYSGILGRGYRLTILFFAPLIQIAVISQGYFIPYGLTVLEILMLWFAVAGNYTAISRALNTWDSLKS